MELFFYWVTEQIGSRKETPTVVCVQVKGKGSWCLATDRGYLKVNEIKNFYGKRWTMEPGFRGTKNIRFGMGMYGTDISKPERRARLFFIAAIATFMLTILGATSESLGFDRYLKSNTSKKIYSLYRQGNMWYELMPNYE